MKFDVIKLIVCATALSMLLISSILYVNSSYNLISSANSILLSPLNQFQSGIDAENVKCDEGLQLVIKKEDNSPACVRPQTATKLMTLGWAVSKSSNISEQVDSSVVTITKLTSKIFLTEQTKQDITRLVSDSYKKLTNPYPIVKYESINYEVEITDYNYQNNTFSIRSNATAKISGLQEYEKYLLDAMYSNTTSNRIFNIQLIHETKYVPDYVARKAIEEAIKDNAVQEFFANYPAAHNYGFVSYLDPLEVQRMKFPETYGGNVIENNEYSFLPDSSSVLLVGFPAYPPPPPNVTTVETPGVNVYLDSTTFKILGSEKKHWTSN